MDALDQFVKYIKLDEEERILISLQNDYESYLQDEQVRTMLNEGAKSVLKDDFVQLEIGKNICRITVSEGTADKNLEVVKTELVQGLQLAMAFLTQMQNKPKTS